MRKSRPASVHEPENIEELRTLMQRFAQEGQPYNFVGSSHSYNGVQLLDNNAIIKFTAKKGEFNKIDYDYTTQRVTVGPAVTIKQLKFFLRPLGRQLITSGNYMEQRMIGALMTGTHGYGSMDAIMADSITAVTVLGEDGQLRTYTEDTHEEILKVYRVSFGALGAIVRVTLRTKANEQYRVTQKLLRLSSLPQQLEEIEGAPHALSMFPYSDETDPYIAVVFLERLTEYEKPPKAKRGNPIKSAFLWSIIKTLWFLLRKCKWLGPCLQGILNKVGGLVNIEPVVTSPQDLDYLYDNSPMLESERNPNVLLKLFSSTFTANNVAVFIPRDELHNFLKFLSELAEELKKDGRYFKNLQGARYVAASSKCSMAGNYQRDGYAIDMFFGKKELALAETVQDRVHQAGFTIRPHWGKSILKKYYLKNFDAGVLETFIGLRREASPSKQLRPNLYELQDELW